MSPRTPAVNSAAFNCPWCQAYTTQHWHELYANTINNESRVPLVVSQEVLDKAKDSGKISPEALATGERMVVGEVFVDYQQRKDYLACVRNLFMSQCFNCKRPAIWIHNSLLWPSSANAVLPNPDLPAEIIRDFEEARVVLNMSPRSAAALLRLCVQRLCAHLGEKGQKIDDDIASLVSKGLNPTVQKSLDIVRVIGNEAVHPGVMNLKDDRETALQLFGLVNLIADQMISSPKMVDALYESLPEEKRKAIEVRNEKARN